MYLWLIGVMSVVVMWFVCEQIWRIILWTLGFIQVQNQQPQLDPRDERIAELETEVATLKERGGFR